MPQLRLLLQLLVHVTVVMLFITLLLFLMLFRCLMLLPLLMSSEYVAKVLNSIANRIPIKFVTTARYRFTKVQ